MVKEGVLDNPEVDAIFGLHVFPMTAGTIEYRSGPLMASGDGFTIRIKGKQTHGAVPWGGVDPIVVGAQIVMALQTIVSRTVNITEAPAVVTIGAFNGGNRFNIIPETVELLGTVRAFNEDVRKDIHRRIRDIATKTAEAAGATAEITYGIGYPATINDAALTEKMVPTLRRVAGADNVRVGPLTGTAEDFSYYQQKVPGMFFFLGVTPKGVDPKTVPQNHSPLFFADESALPVGVRAMTNLALDYLYSQRQTVNHHAWQLARPKGLAFTSGSLLVTFDRRQFLTTSTLALAGTAFARVPLLAQAGQPQTPPRHDVHRHQAQRRHLHRPRRHHRVAGQRRRRASPSTRSSPRRPRRASRGCSRNHPRASSCSSTRTITAITPAETSRSVRR